MLNALLKGEVLQIPTYKYPVMFTHQHEHLFAGMMLVMIRVHQIQNEDQIYPSISKRGVYYHGDCFFNNQEDSNCIFISI